MSTQVTLTGRGQYMTVDAATPDGLSQVLAFIATHPRGWNSIPASKLIVIARAELTPLAQSIGASIDETLSAAWELWQAGIPDTVENPWAYTSRAIRRALGREQEAQRKLTSVTGLRRRGADTTVVTGTDIPERAQLTLVPGVARPRITGDALVAARQFLVMAGLDPHTADEVLDAVASGAATSANHAAACDRLSRDAAMGARYGFTHTQWRALVSLILGTTRGRPGLLVLAMRGHPNPMAFSYIRRASTRLLADERLEVAS